MNFLKKNRSTIIAVLVFLIVLIIVFKFIGMITGDEEKAIYGDRIDGIEAVQITRDKEQQIEEAIKNDTSKVSIKTAGRLVTIIATVQPEMSRDVAKNLANEAIKPLKADQLKYFDIQIIIKKDTEDASFPIIGYRQHTKDTFVWTKDR